MTKINLLSATDLLKRYADKSLSPVRVIKEVFDCIDRHDCSVNAFVMLDKDGAMKEAQASESRWKQGKPKGILDGVPTTVKDVVIAKGWSILRGSNTANETPSIEDAPSVARLREQGAILIGKTTTPEFGWKGVTDSPRSGVTRNPWNLGMTTGGSSGGAAAAAALGMGALHIGTDGGGSIRMPCGFTGIPGIKPTFARVPTYPLSLFGTISHAGPMARTVSDLALMLNVMALPDSRDPYSKPYVAEDFTRNIEMGIKDLKIAYFPKLNDQPIDPEVAKSVNNAVNSLTQLGAQVDRPDLKFTDSTNIFKVHWYVGAAQALRSLSHNERKQVDPGLVEISEKGEQINLQKLQESVSLREELSVSINKLFDNYDLIITPTLPLTAFEVGKNFPEGKGYDDWIDWTQFTYPFNLTGHPAGTVPCGLSQDGLPIAMQIIGPTMADALVIRAMRAFETIYPSPLPPMAHL